VTHKAFVEVNEGGTEAAAAASAIGVVTIGVPEKPKPPVEFIANHPFVFVIRERRCGLILFLGRVSEPTRA
jgi:serpin B